MIELPLRFVEMSAQTTDFDFYDKLARPEMKPDDFISGSDLRQRIVDERARAWMVNLEDGSLAGWCAIMMPSPCHASPTAIHLLGNVVFGDKKGRGLGKAMARWRVKKFGEHPLTASVQPGNVPSERVLTSCGFQPGLPTPKGPWTVWHRPSNQQQHALVRWLETDDVVEQSIVHWAASDVIQGMRQQGWYVEGIPDNEAATTRDQCANALWPDPAAFHSVIDVNFSFRKKATKLKAVGGQS